MSALPVLTPKIPLCGGPLEATVAAGKAEPPLSETRQMTVVKDGVACYKDAGVVQFAIHY
ncbi:hypothetical protein AUK40_01320 [Candidatus Wirthbacteria bacterium CG2_30_54_11]|uniref:Uncharacterized protein n=1 Tax=Candidatus Wirthbacteria bacterium CG2_30_54_11 TaxID=1817892 RepID=A0A1J5INC9_9BACT|nr:MAG: hypothetical protein AUK40_01320 [Candidatus Wirthbacteria bacterium CG2_30_54_11]